MLKHVLQTARAGDPDSVCAAFEECASELLQPARCWFKIAGGTKAEVILAALASAPRAGSILEIGTYFGYSAIRLAMSQANRRVVTMEVDPGNAMVAEYLIAYAGLAHRVDVRMGHSKDLLRHLRAGHPPGLSFAAVFMDQCGSRFWSDLEELLQSGLLLPGAMVLADNVLKPGAPLFLWRTFFSAGRFRARAVSVPEFGMPGVEDWVAVVECMPAEAAHLGAAPREPPPAVFDLEWEAHRVRLRASGPGGIDFQDWAVFASWMRGRLAALGIRPEAEGAQGARALASVDD